MSEDKRNLISLFPEAINNSANNLTDKVTKNMGDTFADIWYLVFGGFSHIAEKRKLKYSYAIQEFEKELKEKISKIPTNKFIDPDIQVVAKALEEAKYCIDKEELRHMFSSLISSSMNSDFYVSPTIVNIVSLLSPIDAKILDFFYQYNKEIDKEADEINKMIHSNKLTISENFIDDKIAELNKRHFSFDDLMDNLNTSSSIIIHSLVELEHLNLICSHNFDKDNKDKKMIYQNLHGNFIEIEKMYLSNLGNTICRICLDE